MTSAISPQTVLITGATGGIGGALVDVYAEPGNTLILQGRNAARLAVIASPIRPTGYTAVPNPNCCKNGNVFSAARRPSAMASSAR